MPEYYYQIKGKHRLDDGDISWSWAPLHSGKIEASTSKEARKMLEEEFGKRLPGRASKDLPYLLTIIDMSSKPYLQDRFKSKVCKQCGQEYTLNDKYIINAGGQREFCSASCMADFNYKEGIGKIIYGDVNTDFNGIHLPVIYKITCRATGKCYIGKTTQAFTLRWYQHFYQGSGTKFHTAIKEFGITEWTFEIIEIVDCLLSDRNKKMLERESFWINHFDSIVNGYNSVIPKKDEQAIDNKTQIELNI